MSSPETRTYEDPLDGIKANLERGAPFFRPALVWLTASTFVVLAFFLIVLWKHLPFGWSALDMATTGSVGEFIGGTIGTALTAIASFLLLVTLWVQMKEYGLARQEMTKSVEAQNSMAKAQQEQLDLLQEQNQETRKDQNLQRVTAELTQFKKETLKMHAPKVARIIGMDFIPQLGHTLTKTWIPALDDKSTLHGTEIDTALKQHLMAIHLLVQRAYYLYMQIQVVPLLPMMKQIRERELVYFVKCHYVVHMTKINEIRVAIDGIQLNDDYSIGLKKLLSTMCEDTFASLRLLDNITLVEPNDDITRGMRMPDTIPVSP